MSRALWIVALLSGVASAGGPARKKPVPAKVAPAPIGPDTAPVIYDAPGTLEILAKLPQSDPRWADFAVRAAGELERTAGSWTARAAWLGERADAAKPDARAKLETQRAEAEAKAKQARARARSLLETTVALPSARTYAKLDEALFRLATAYQQAGEMGKARVNFQRLIKDYPASVYIPDAYLAFAEYYFEQNDMANARAFYDKVTQFPKARVYGYALYKLAWVDFNLGDAAKALQDFVNVAAAVKDGPLRREALKDMVTVYAQVGGPDKAAAFFQRIAPEAAGGLLERLAQTYDDAGNAKAAAVVRASLPPARAVSPATAPRAP